MAGKGTEKTLKSGVKTDPTDEDPQVENVEIEVKEN